MQELAVMQKSIPVVITFHGSDINMKKNYIFSRLASNLSANNIFVHKNLPSKLKNLKVKYRRVLQFLEHQ